MKNTMKKNIILIFIALAACIFSITCQNPITGGEDVVGNGGGLIAISIGGGGRAAEETVPWANTLDPSDLTHTITLNGEGGPHTSTVSAGGGTARFSVIPGEWTILVEAFYLGDLVAVGSQSIQINQGNNGTITIQMYEPSDFPAYTVTFDSNGGSEIESQTVKKYSKATSETPDKRGYGFADWYSDIELTSSYNFDTPVTDNITLYAGWSEDFRTVTFIDGNITVETKNIAYNKHASAPDNYTKTGYTGAWYKEPTFNTLWDFNTNTVTANMELYVEWKANTYYVEFNSNGGSGSMTEQTFIYGTPQALEANEYEKKDNIFEGWATSLGGAKVYGDGEIVSNLTATSGGRITLHAVWTATVTVTFESNGGSAVETQIVKKNSTATSVTPILSGHGFAGWFTDVALTNQFSFNTPVTENITLYAKWSKDFYTVTFYNGSTVVTTLDIAYDEYASAPDVPNPGYTGAWYKESTFNTLWNFNSNPVNSNMSLYVKWTPITYTLNLDANGGTGGQTTVSVDYDQPMPAIASVSLPTRTGYTFNGYFDAASGGKKYYDANGYSATNWDKASTAILYAQWTINSYTVTFDKNGGDTEADPKTRTANYNTTVTLPTAPTRTGYVFNGWYPSADGSGTAFTASTTVSGNTTVYAKWASLNVGTTTGWTDIINAIKNVGSGTSSSVKNYTINITDDFSTASNTSVTFGSITYINVTITGNKTITLTGTGNLLRLGANQTVVIHDTNFKGNSGNNTALIYLTGSNASLTMEGSSSVHSNISSSYSYGGGVYVSGTSATFTMKDTASVHGNTTTGGTSTGNGGGVYVNSGTFTMQDTASVYGNITTGSIGGNGGGVYVSSNAIFNMEDNSSMYGNEAHGSGTRGNGGGVQSDGTFNMQGNSTIYENTAYCHGGGVDVANGSFTMEGNSSVQDNNSASHGGGVYVNSGTFTMQGATASEYASVHDNTALEGNGGGVYVSSNTTFNMYGYSSVYLNTAKGYANTGGGGGVQAVGSFNMYDNSSVYLNTAGNNGGGVDVNNGTFTMYDNSSVYNNVTSEKVSTIMGSSTYNGGGVNIGIGTFNMRGGTIYGNDAQGNGGGVCVGSWSSSIFQMETGTIYGTGATAKGPNKAITGAAFYKYNSGTAERGTFSGTGDAWVSIGTFSTTENTLDVLNGVVQ